MNLQLIADFFGWMLLINIILLIIGYLKLTVFKNFTKMVMVHLFGEQSNALYGADSTRQCNRLLMTNE